MAAIFRNILGVKMTKDQKKSFSKLFFIAKNICQWPQKKNVQQYANKIAARWLFKALSYNWKYRNRKKCVTLIDVGFDLLPKALFPNWFDLFHSFSALKRLNLLRPIYYSYFKKPVSIKLCGNKNKLLYIKKY